MRRTLIFALLALAACDKDPDKRTTVAESQVSARAIADVDAAMADARKAKPLPAQVSPAPTE